MTVTFDLWQTRPLPVDVEDLDFINIAGSLQYTDTREELVAALQTNFERAIDAWTAIFAHDVLVMAVKTYMRLPNRNRYTAAIVKSMLSDTELLDDTAHRQIVCFMREIKEGIPELYQGYVDNIIIGTDPQRSYSYNKYYVARDAPNYDIRNPWLRERYDDAIGIAALMREYEVLPTLAHFMEDGDFIRNQYLSPGQVSLITLGNISFLRLAGHVGSAELPPKTSLMLGDGWQAFAPPAARLANQTDGVKVATAGRACHITIAADDNNAKETLTLNRDATQAITLAQLKRGFTVASIAPPAITATPLPDQTLAVGVTQSVSIANLFTGFNITRITTASSNVHRLRTQTVGGEQSIGIVGVAEGTVTVTVTATNISGSTDRTFQVTITPAPSEGD